LAAQNVEQNTGRRASRKSLVQELLETVLLTALLFGVAKFSVQNFQVDGMSMDPTLQNNEMILVDKVSYHFHNGLPSRGDIIVFHAPLTTGQFGKDFIKRVIALPGDVVTIKPINNVNRVFVDHKMLNESYILERMRTTDLPNCIDPRGCTTIVPPHDVFVMGDNRNNSYDSRAWGPLAQSAIIGRALIAYWPLSHLSLLTNR
jgi:signal peptidase I